MTSPLRRGFTSLFHGPGCYDWHPGPKGEEMELLVGFIIGVIVLVLVVLAICPEILSSIISSEERGDE